MEEATEYKKYLEGLKKATKKEPFLKRRIELAGKDALDYATKAAKATKIGKIAGAVAAAGIAGSAFLRSKMKDIKEKQQSKELEEDVKGSAGPFMKKSKGGMNKYSEGKSVKGYGQARKSGMGLEDESISLGKGSDYIKDLI